jgi:hypothetical protein
MAAVTTFLGDGTLVNMEALFLGHRTPFKKKSLW